MKIQLTQACNIGGNLYKKDTKIIVDNNTAKRLIRKKFAVSKEFITLHEIEAAKESKIKAQEILEKLPTKAKDIIKATREISNRIVLDHLLSHPKITVRKAAFKRLEQMRN